MVGVDWGRGEVWELKSERWAFAEWDEESLEGLSWGVTLSDLRSFWLLCLEMAVRGKKREMTVVEQRWQQAD